MKLLKSVFEGLPDINLRMNNKWTAWAAIQRYYCGPMTMSNRCTADCSNCMTTLLKLVDLRKAQNPMAFLIYSCKLEAAKANEVARPIEVKLDQYGMVVTEDPFQEILSSL